MIACAGASGKLAQERLAASKRELDGSEAVARIALENYELRITNYEL